MESFGIQTLKALSPDDEGFPVIGVLGYPSVGDSNYRPVISNDMVEKYNTILPGYRAVTPLSSAPTYSRTRYSVRSRRFRRTASFVSTIASRAMASPISYWATPVRMPRGASRKSACITLGSFSMRMLRMTGA